MQIFHPLFWLVVQANKEMSEQYLPSNSNVELSLFLSRLLVMPEQNRTAANRLRLDLHHLNMKIGCWSCI